MGSVRTPFPYKPRTIPELEREFKEALAKWGATSGLGMQCEQGEKILYGPHMVIRYPEGFSARSNTIANWEDLIEMYYGPVARVINESQTVYHSGLDPAMTWRQVTYIFEEGVI